MNEKQTQKRKNIAFTPGQYDAIRRAAEDSGYRVGAGCTSQLKDFVVMCLATGKAVSGLSVVCAEEK